MKKYFLGLTAFILAVGFSAYTTSNTESKKLTGAWYSFTGDPTDEFEHVDASKYTIITPTPNCPLPANDLCQMFLDPSTIGDADGILEDSDLEAIRDAGSPYNPDADAFFDQPVTNLVKLRN